MRHVHNAGSNPFRMPAILRKEDRDAWLIGTPEQARAVLNQYDAGLMVAYEVTTAVNSPKNNSSSNLVPI
jgi:putative SOS response-associated peptidase YedK